MVIPKNSFSSILLQNEFNTILLILLINLLVFLSVVAVPVTDTFTAEEMLPLPVSVSIFKRCPPPHSLSYMKTELK